MTSPQWRKSSRSSDGTSGQCVEVAQLDDAIGLRDSKAPSSGHLSLTIGSFAGLVARAKRNELDFMAQP
ncbi:DUF397 domain-containing protein [Actinomadura citrea]|uniref:DUF397 domain-containing protein n=1 Tax=Actinomadura citrea TaxID=46158 RepID=A0A7Y9KJN2_9ACTN|nr:DUF397 domain-containing protein [Actinomadura citrea]NYE17964.1 hypothetical protein [Actinomadura citrea]GGT62730.1 hypothetical protein GCM10010177_19700 [Actinomadura citrea]